MKGKDFIKDWLGYIISALIVCVYVGMAVIDLQETGKSVAEILGEAAIILLLGISISQTMSYQGYQKGLEEEPVKKVYEERDRLILEISKSESMLESFCDTKNTHALKTVRTRLLSKQGMKYDDVFKDGEYNDKWFPIDKNDAKHIKARKRAKNKAIKHAITVKITLITPNDFKSDISKNNDPLHRGRSSKQYFFQTSAFDIFNKVIAALAGSYYVVQTINANRAEIMYRLIISIILLAIAGLRYYGSYRHVTTEHKDRIAISNSWATEFVILCAEGKIKPVYDYEKPKVEPEIKPIEIIYEKGENKDNDYEIKETAKNDTPIQFSNGKDTN